MSFLSSSNGQKNYVRKRVYYLLYNFQRKKHIENKIIIYREFIQAKIISFKKIYICKNKKNIYGKQKIKKTNDMANLTFYYSTMNAGKTIDVIKTAFNFETEKIPVIIFTSAIDTRSGSNKIKSRMGMEKEAISIQQDENLLTKIEEIGFTSGCILVDEVQFFTVEQIWQLFTITHQLQIPVVCYGLRGDFMGKPFPGSAQLMAIANKVEEIRTICWCGRKAIMNARIVEGKMVREGEQFMVGGNESYKALCGIHWLKCQCKKEQ